MLPETDEYRVASDGLSYTLNEFILWFPSTWYWYRLPVYDLQKHADDVAEAEGVCPGTPSDIDMVSDDEAPLITEFDVVCCTVDGREFTFTCDGMTSIGSLRLRVAQIERAYPLILHDGFELTEDYFKVHWVLRHEDDKRLQVILRQFTRFTPLEGTGGILTSGGIRIDVRNVASIPLPSDDESSWV